eukprot:9498045-Pyramimonas_sp.AAC.1
MHTVDQGTCSHILGNILKEIIYEQRDESPAEACAVIWRRIRKIYDERNIPHRITYPCRRAPDRPLGEGGRG